MSEVEVDNVGEREELFSLVEKIIHSEYPSTVLLVENEKGQLVNMSFINTGTTISEVVSVP